MRSRSTRRTCRPCSRKGEEVEYGSDGTTLTATADGRIVFTLTVNADGSWSFDLEDQLDHVLDSGDTGTMLQTTGGAGAGIDFSALIIATDFDGDATEGAVAGSFVVTIENDVPVANEGREAITFDGGRGRAVDDAGRSRRSVRGQSRCRPGPSLRRGVGGSVRSTRCSMSGPTSR